MISVLLFSFVQQIGTSPLHLAAQHGHTETAEVLLRAGVSRDAKTKVCEAALSINVPSVGNIRCQG